MIFDVFRNWQVLFSGNPDQTPFETLDFRLVAISRMALHGDKGDMRTGSYKIWRIESLRSKWRARID